jgi:DNA-binding response OmpR family regulator
MDGTRIKHHERSLLFFESSPNLLPIKGELRKRGFLIFECRTSAEVQFAIVWFPIDLILIDLLIPGEPSGYEVCRQLREGRQIESIPVFLFCDHPLPVQVTQSYSYELKAERLLLPPLDPVYIARQIDVSLRRREGLSR